MNRSVYLFYDRSCHVFSIEMSTNRTGVINNVVRLEHSTSNREWYLDNLHQVNERCNFVFKYSVRWSLRDIRELKWHFLFIGLLLLQLVKYSTREQSNIDKACFIDDDWDVSSFYQLFNMIIIRDMWIGWHCQIIKWYFRFGLVDRSINLKIVFSVCYDN